MRPGCELNASPKIRILAQRTGVARRYKGRPIGHKNGEHLVGHKEHKRSLSRWRHTLILRLICLKGWWRVMKTTCLGDRLRTAAVLCFMGVLAAPAVPSVKNWAVVVSAGSKLQDIPLADLVTLCKGTQKTWPDGKNFTLVIRAPESSEMKVAIQKLFGLSPNGVMATIAKLNESRQVVKIVDSEADLLRTVEATPGAVGIVDVYSINSSVKVLRVNGKLPFDFGYVLKGT